MTSRVALSVDGSTRLFTVPFPFLHRTHVQFVVNRTVQLTPLHFRWISDDTVEFQTAPSGVLEINRQTPVDGPLVSFRNGAALTEDELNTAVLQNLYISQELRDYYDALIDGSLDDLVTNTGSTAGTVIDKVVEEILNSVLLADLQQRITDIDTNAATITAQRIDLDGVTDMVNDLAQLNGVPLKTFILNVQQESIDGDTALASDLSLLGAKSGDALSWILDLDKVKVSPTEALGTRLSALQSSIDGNAATIASEQTARVTQDDALASWITNVEATANNNSALITSEQTARADADSALTTRIDGMLVTVNDNTALILAEQTARADGDSAEATARQVLQTQVDGNTASIEQTSTVVDGLKAQYMVKTDVNGYVAGFGLYNEGASSDFIVLVDRFAMVTPGQNPVVPFAADANGVYMDNAYIRNLTVDKITGGAIKSQWNLDNTAGRIVLDTGAYMKVIGVGFGANADLIEWFGPKMAISACTKANAKTYVAMDGGAYFGGSLSAGTLYNAAETTSIGVPVSAVVGPFATNGNTKTVVVSYTYSHTDMNAPASIGNGPGGTATIKLYRTIGSGSEVLLATYTVQFTRWSEQDINWQVSETGSGSWTYTDTVAGTQDLQYRVEVASRTGTADISTQPSQRAGAVITEE